MAQWVKDPALSLLWLGFNPCSISGPGTSRTLGSAKKKKKKKKERKRKKALKKKKEKEVLFTKQTPVSCKSSSRCLPCYLEMLNVMSKVIFMTRLLKIHIKMRLKETIEYV